MKRVRFWPALALLSLLVIGCSSGEKTVTESGGTAAPSSSKKAVAVAAFEGGFGIDFYQRCAKEFGDKNNLDIKVEGSPKIWEKLQPQFVSGDVPDLTFPGWGMDVWKLAYEDQLLDLNSALDEKPFEGEGKWRDTFVPSLLKLGEYNGKQYMLPYFFSVEGWWYNPDLFAKHGWTPPTTYEELLTLCEKIKAAGIAPLTYQGQYPDYMLEGFLVPWIISAGGNEALDDCQNLKPGAWKSTAVLRAAQMVAELHAKGYFQEGCSGMNHTQAQTEFVNGRAAMVPCGSWLYAEMQKSMPPGTKMEYMLVPHLAAGKGDPTALGIRIEPWMVPAKAKNQKEGVELFKYMTSLENAKKFVEEKGTLMAIKGSDKATFPDNLKKAAASFFASTAAWSAEYRSWYKEFNKELEGAMSGLLSGELTPEKFCDRVEAKAEATRADNSVVKRTYLR